MRIAIDFDGTIVKDDKAYDDLETPLELVEGAEAAIHALARAGHHLIVYSARANLAIREDWKRHPGWLERGYAPPGWESSARLNELRYQQMVQFILARFGTKTFWYIDDGRQGKVSADLFIDDRAFPGGTPDWETLAYNYGEVLPDE